MNETVRKKQLRDEELEVEEVEEPVAITRTNLTFDVDLKYICTFALVLPLVAFISCIVLSLVRNFEVANRTHCGSKTNASISNFYPQIALWRLLIGIDSFPRYLIAYIYYKNYYASKCDKMRHKYHFKWLINAAFLFHIVELTSLLSLSYVSSLEIFSVHMFSFLVFLVSSSLYMALTLLSYHWPLLENREPVDLVQNTNEVKSKNMKLAIFVCYAVCMFAALYFYIRHNSYCESFVYSVFSFCEYLTVLANIGYHSMIFYDLKLFSRVYKISMFEKVCKLNND